MASTYRYTRRDIDDAIRGLNRVAGFTNEELDTPMSSGARVGLYYLMGAYGGWQLVQIVNAHGGIRSITQGYCSKRELFAQIRAYRAGMSAGQVGDYYSIASIRERAASEGGL